MARSVDPEFVLRGDGWSAAATLAADLTWTVVVSGGVASARDASAREFKDLLGRAMTVRLQTLGGGVPPSFGLPQAYLFSHVAGLFPQAEITRAPQSGGGDNDPEVKY